jgi:hypothetical protein
MYSQRFNRSIILTKHAKIRMQERNISEVELLEVIDNSHIRTKDDTHFWSYKNFDYRTDNLICAVLVLESVLVVKTVMHEFNVEE